MGILSRFGSLAVAWRALVLTAALPAAIPCHTRADSHYFRALNIEASPMLSVERLKQPTCGAATQKPGSSFERPSKFQHSAEHLELNRDSAVGVSRRWPPKNPKVFTNDRFRCQPTCLPQ